MNKEKGLDIEKMKEAPRLGAGAWVKPKPPKGNVYYGYEFDVKKTESRESRFKQPDGSARMELVGQIFMQQVVNDKEVEENKEYNINFSQHASLDRQVRTLMPLEGKRISIMIRGTVKGKYGKDVFDYAVMESGQTFVVRSVNELIRLFQAVEASEGEEIEPLETEVSEAQEINRWTFRGDQLKRLINETGKATQLTKIFEQAMQALRTHREKAQELIQEWNETRIILEDSIAKLEGSIRTAETIEKTFEAL